MAACREGCPLLFPMTVNRQLLQELGRGWFQSQCRSAGGASPRLCLALSPLGRSQCFSLKTWSRAGHLGLGPTFPHLDGLRGRVPQASAWFCEYLGVFFSETRGPSHTRSLWDPSIPHL